MNMDISEKNLTESKNNCEFKVPLPKKRSAFQKVHAKSDPKVNLFQHSLSMAKSSIEKSQYMSLLYKLLTSPGQLSKQDKDIIRGHPLISNMLKVIKESQEKTNELYIPIDVFLNPEIFMKAMHSDNKLDHNCSAQGHSHNKYDAVHVNIDDHKQDCTFIGKYTLAERRQRILKYKQKVRNWLKGNKPLKLKKKAQPLENKREIKAFKHSLENSDAKLHESNEI